MREAARIAAALVVALCLLGLPRRAMAIGPVDVEGGGFIGYGTNPSNGPNPLGVGIGARAGAQFYGIYAGLSLTYYFGTSADCGGGAPTSGEGVSSLPASYCSAGAGEVQINQQTVLYGVDLGYTLTMPRLKWLKFRPLLELGDAQITRTGTLGMQDLTTGATAQYRSENGFYLQPGLTVMLAVESFFFAVDGNLLLIPGITDIDGVTSNAAGVNNLVTSKRTLAAFTTHAQIGFRF